MKLCFKLLLVLTLAAVLGCALLGCGGGAGPEATVRDALKAMDDMDADRLAGYLTEDVAEEAAAGLEMIFAMIDDIKISNLKTSVLSESGDAATVEIECDIEVTAFGETEKNQVKESLDLRKVDGKWRITELPEFE